MNLGLLSEMILLCAVFLLTVGGVYVFRSIAISNHIVAVENHRNLHQGLVPRGGGSVFSSVFLVAVTGLWLGTIVDKPIFLAIVPGGVIVALIGFIDDVFDISAARKLFVQCLTAAWILFVVGGQPFIVVPQVPSLFNLVLSWFCLVWLMNSYNFMDGTDGMAASGAVFICVASIVSLFLVGTDRSLMLVIAVLGVSCSGFLLFNWPPASIFMGDSGSLFLGYCFGALITLTVTGGTISLWTWLIVFGYFAGDTSTTTLLRIFLVKRWYGAHRSNAYQNVARISGSHQRVVLGVCFYHVFWLLPLTIWSVLAPSTAPLAAILGLAPVVFWTFRFGPRLSSS